MSDVSDIPDDRPLLLFFSSRRSGPARRMAGLVASVNVNEKRRLKVVEVDIDVRPDLAAGLNVTGVPALVLVDRQGVLGRLEGRVTGRQIDRFLEPHLAAR